MLVYFLVSLYLITFVLLLISSIRKPKSVHRFILKLINCSLFIGITIASYYTKEVNFHYFISLVLAQGLSFLGDTFLGAKHLNNKKICGALGVLFFALAQIIFISIFISNYGFVPYLLFIPILGLVIGEYILYRLNISDIKMKIVIGFYMLLMTSMFMVSLGALINNTSNATILVALGGFSFMISDYTLVFKYYYPAKRVPFTYVSVSTYALAQMLFSLSVLF